MDERLPVLEAGMKWEAAELDRRWRLLLGWEPEYFYMCTPAGVSEEAEYVEAEAEGTGSKIEASSTSRASSSARKFSKDVEV